MTYVEKQLAAIEALEAKGNSEEEAINIFVGYVNLAVTELPQRAHYSREYCDKVWAERNTAIVNLRSLPYGQEILNHELANRFNY